MATMSLPANNNSFTSSAPGGATRQGMDLPGMLDLLAHGAISARQDIPWGSNYTFIVQIEKAPFRTLAIYKPQRGENPLWDFEWGTLCKRETAAYLISAALDWDLVPPTVLPAASAGASFQVNSSSGMFQGEITPTMPCGCRSV